MTLSRVAPAESRQAAPSSVFLSSGGSRTGPFAEVEAWCREWPKRARGRVRCEKFGTTPEGRPMVALVVAEDRRLTPPGKQRAVRPVVLAIGGIHAGEIDGKDAGDLLLREWLLEAGGKYPGVTFVFVPVFNVDGFARFGPRHRPNQDGPTESGFRTTSANLNLNRDFMKADAPEMQALLRLVQRWSPSLVLDLHVTNGADFPADVGVIVRPSKQGPVALRPVADRLRASMLEALSSDGFVALPYYPEFRTPDDPTSGVDDGDPPPRFSHGYFPLRGRVSVLVETHAWKPYARRVFATRAALRGALAYASREGGALVAAVREAEAEALRLPGQGVVLATRVDRTRDRTVPFEAYGWSTEESAALGRPVVRYDRNVRRSLSMPFSDEVVPTVRELAPVSYVVPPAAAAWLGPRLKAHGISFSTLARGRVHPVEVFRAVKVTPAPRSVEGRQRLEVEGAWTLESRELAKGSLVVPVAQSLGRVVVALFEPRAPDSFLAWGAFNAHFEQKEYLEPYVADAAAALLLEDPATSAAFEAALRDPAFAASPERRLDWIYRHHPAHDERRDLYPVWRLPADGPALDSVKLKPVRGTLRRRKP